MIGDVDSTERGSGARFNSGKPDLSLIPLKMLAASYASRALSETQSVALTSLNILGVFQETGDQKALVLLTRQLRRYWPDAAKIFTYGIQKYAAWNWAKGMAWSVPIACAARHAVAVLEAEDEDHLMDLESGEHHLGHLLCNVVMLLHYTRCFGEGNDLPPPELFATDPVDIHPVREEPEGSH